MAEVAQEVHQEDASPLHPLERWIILPLLFVLDLILGYGCPSIQRFWATLFYLLSYPFMGAKRKIAAANLQIAFPDLTPRERGKLLRRNMRYMIEMGLDWLHFFIHPQRAVKRLDVADNPVIASLRQRPPESPNVICCTPHLGNWELEAHISFLTGRNGAVIAASFTSPLLTRLVANFRKSCKGTTFIPVKGAARGMLRAWKAKRDLGVLIDQNISPKHGGIFVPFFGLPAATSNLPATMAKHLNAPIYITACIKNPDGKFSMEAEPLPLPQEFETPEKLTAAIMQGYERVIRRHPEQYLWLYPRWRYIPANAPDAYREKLPFYARSRHYTAPEEFFN